MSEVEGRSLSQRLRDAALERARRDGQLVDSYVLDADGVIDLRAFEPHPDGPQAFKPAGALAETRGRIGDAAEVTALYDKEAEERRWSFGRRGPASAPAHADTSSRRDRFGELTQLSSLPASSPRDQPAGLSSTSPAPVPLAESPEGDLSTSSPEPVMDLTSNDEASQNPSPDDDDRPIRPCPSCHATGRRDLFDRFSQTEFYSCDDCLHMWQVKRGD